MQLVAHIASNDWLLRVPSGHAIAGPFFRPMPGILSSKVRNMDVKIAWQMHATSEARQDTPDHGRFCIPSRSHLRRRGNLVCTQ